MFAGCEETEKNRKTYGFYEAEKNIILDSAFQTAGKVKRKKTNLFIFQDINLNDLEAQ